MSIMFPIGMAVRYSWFPGVYLLFLFAAFSCLLSSIASNTKPIGMILPFGVTIGLAVLLGRAVVCGYVVFPCNEHEVIGSVIGAVMVDVMHDFSGQKRTSQYLLHD